MSDIYFISDTHFGHEATFARFKNTDGTPLRPFTSVDEMNRTMIENWNARVQPEDTVIHLGDVVMSHRYLPLVAECNGRKILVQGNHDPIGGKKGRKFDFDAYFDDVVAHKLYEDMILTHIPIHPDSIGRFGTNVHGHLHGTEVMQNDPEFNLLEGGDIPQIPDPRYLCVSVEHIDFAPIRIEEVRERIEARRKQYNYVAPVAWGNGSAM